VDKEVMALDEEFELRAIEFRSNCDDGNGNSGACHSLGEYEAVVNSDFKKAAEIYSKNCTKNNHGASCFNLARLYLAGKGVENNDAQAAALSGKACEYGHKQACYHSAILLLHGVGAKKDVPKACKLLNTACSDGISEACYKLASIYLKGKDPVKRNPATAEPLLLQACDRGWAPACQCLAVMYKNGDGPVKPDAALFKKYSEFTTQLVQQAGGMKGHKTA
jgi:TPR repeat protein